MFPRPADHPWADVVSLAVPAEASREVVAYRAELEAAAMSDKIAGAVPADGSEALEYGRHITDTARARKESAWSERLENPIT